MDLSSEIQFTDLKARDIIILFVGLLGSGKSNIIDHLAQLSNKRAGAGLGACTEKFAAIRIRSHPTYGDRLVLIDSPGFEGAEKSDGEILIMFQGKLKAANCRRIRLAGIIYVHRITDNRIGYRPAMNIKIFKDLCGDNALKKVLLATTMWDKARLTTAEDREAELKAGHWRTLVEMGANVGRFSNEQESAWDLVKSLVGEIPPDTDALEEGTSEVSTEGGCHPKQEIGAETGPSSYLNLNSDIVIALMGPTGSGKSTIIDYLTDHREKRASSKLKPSAQAISAIRIENHPIYGNRLLLVDTPGFDDAETSDADILQIIGNWLKETYEREVPLAGIIYLHRIKDNRMAGAPHRNLRMLGKLCGDNAAKKVLLVTTMWDLVPRAMAEEREKELKEKFWSTMLEKGADVGQFYNNKASAWKLVEMVLKETTTEVLLLQEELVLLKRKLNETSAGKELYTTLQRLLSEQKRTVSLLAEQARLRQDTELAAQLDQQLKEIQNNLEQTFRQIEKLKIPFLRKIMLFFSRGPQSRAIEVG